MSKFTVGILGAAALFVSLGAAQFAVGRDLTGPKTEVAAPVQSILVDRSIKSDRQAGAAPVSGSTIVTQMSALNDTSVVIRVPRQSQSNGKAIGKIGRRPVACEAPASVLSEIAQHLESGHCVT